LRVCVSILVRKPVDDLPAAVEHWLAVHELTSSLRPCIALIQREWLMAVNPGRSIADRVYRSTVLATIPRAIQLQLLMPRLRLRRSPTSGSRIALAG
jgi:hypothetical protein